MKYKVSELSPVFRAASRSVTTFFKRGRDVRIPISSLIEMNRDVRIRQPAHVLFIGLDAILLRSNKVKERLGTSIQLVDLSILTLLYRICLPKFIENGEQERPMVQCTILDSIIQFRHLHKRFSRIIHGLKK